MAAPSERCMLMELPVELRCRIWHFTLAEVYHYPTPFRTETWVKSRVSALLVLNKRIKGEVAECFTKSCHVRFRDLPQIAYLFERGDPVITSHLRHISLSFCMLWESLEQVAGRLLPDGDAIRWPEALERQLLPNYVMSRGYGCSPRRFLEAMASLRLGVFGLTITDQDYRTGMGRDDHAHVLGWEAKIPYLIDCVPAGMAIGGTYTVELCIDIEEIVSRSVYVRAGMGLLLRKRERWYRKGSDLEHLEEEHGYGCFTDRGDLNGWR